MDASKYNHDLFPTDSSNFCASSPLAKLTNKDSFLVDSFVFFVLFTSCVQIKFQNPNPFKTKRLTKINK